MIFWERSLKLKTIREESFVKETKKVNGKKEGKYKERKKEGIYINRKKETGTLNNHTKGRKEGTNERRIRFHKYETSDALIWALLFSLSMCIEKCKVESYRTEIMKKYS